MAQEKLQASELSEKSLINKANKLYLEFILLADESTTLDANLKILEKYLAIYCIKNSGNDADKLVAKVALENFYDKLNALDQKLFDGIIEEKIQKLSVNDELDDLVFKDDQALIKQLLTQVEKRAQEQEVNLGDDQLTVNDLAKVNSNNLREGQLNQLINGHLKNFHASLLGIHGIDKEQFDALSLSHRVIYAKYILAFKTFCKSSFSEKGINAYLSECKKLKGKLLANAQKRFFQNCLGVQFRNNQFEGTVPEIIAALGGDIDAINRLTKQGFSFDSAKVCNYLLKSGYEPGSSLKELLNWSKAKKEWKKDKKNEVKANKRERKSSQKKSSLSSKRKKYKKQDSDGYDCGDPETAEEVLSVLQQNQILIDAVAGHYDLSVVRINEDLLEFSNHKKSRKFALKGQETGEIHPAAKIVRRLVTLVRQYYQTVTNPAEHFPMTPERARKLVSLSDRGAVEDILNEIKAEDQLDENHNVSSLLGGRRVDSNEDSNSRGPSQLSQSRHSMFARDTVSKNSNSDDDRQFTIKQQSQEQQVQAVVNSKKSDTYFLATRNVDGSRKTYKYVNKQSDEQDPVTIDGEDNDAFNIQAIELFLRHVNPSQAQIFTGDIETLKLMKYAYSRLKARPVNLSECTYRLNSDSDPIEAGYAAGDEAKYARLFNQAVANIAKQRSKASAAGLAFVNPNPIVSQALGLPAEYALAKNVVKNTQGTDSLGTRQRQNPMRQRLG